MDEPAAPYDTLDGHCLADEVIHALAYGGLESRERSRALAHLDGCEPCRTLLADRVQRLPAGTQLVHGTRRSALLQVGALVSGRYRIERFVARGGMGEVYEAWDVLLSEQVALKTINPLALSTDQEKAIARFKQEVQLSRRVADPHVCRVYEFGQHVVPGWGTLAYLTMEFIEGQTLGARVRQGPRLALSEVSELCRQLLRGLTAAHSVGVLHRDLKSDNVMLRAWSPSAGELHAVIMDFGLSRLLVDHTPALTERHEVLGSVAYMAPEQFEEAAALSEGTDVFAFGVVLFEMLTGRLPFEGKSAAAVALRRLVHKPPAPSRFAPALPSGWDALVLRCLERDVERRFGSTEEVAAALEAVARAPSRSRRRMVAFGTGTLALLVCALAYLALPSRSPAAPDLAETRRGLTTPATTAVVALQPAAALEPPLAGSPVGIAPATAPESELSARRLAGQSSAKRPPQKRRGPARETRTSEPAQAEGVPTPAASQEPRDVRDVFFLDGPGEPRNQNSNQ